MLQEPPRCRPTARQALLWIGCFVAGSLLSPESGGLLAQEKPDEPIGFSLPKLEVPETEYEWETVLQGAVVTYTFPILNVGSAPLKILRVQSNCGCTTPSHSDVIAPGEQGHIALRVATGEVAAGYLRKNATVFTNDPTQGQVILWIRGQVDPILKTDEKFLRVSGVLNEVKESTFRFTPGTDRKTTVLSAKSEKELIEIVSVDPLEGGGATITVRAGAHEKPDLLRDNLLVRVQLDDDKPVEASFPLSIAHLDTVKISPSGKVLFYRRQTAHLERHPDRDVSKEITLRSIREDLSFQILSAQIEDAPEGLFDLSVRTVVPGQHYIIKIRVLRTENESQVTGRLVIETDDQTLPKREIDVMAQFRMRPPG